jgi:hypothetical protein
MKNYIIFSLIAPIVCIAYFSLLRIFYAYLNYADKAFLESERIGTVGKIILLPATAISIYALICSNLLMQSGYSDCGFFLTPWLVSWLDRLFALCIQTPRMGTIGRILFPILLFCLLPIVCFFEYKAKGFGSGIPISFILSVLMFCVFLKYCFDWTASHYFSESNQIKLSQGHANFWSLLKTYVPLLSMGAIIVTFIIYAKLCGKGSQNIDFFTSMTFIAGLCYLAWMNSYLNQFISYCLTPPSVGKKWISRFSNTLTVPTILFICMGYGILCFEVFLFVRHSFIDDLFFESTAHIIASLIIAVFWIILGILAFYLDRIVNDYLASPRIGKIWKMISFAVILPGVFFFTRYMAGIEEVGGIVIMLIILYQCSGTSRGIKTVSR